MPQPRTLATSKISSKGQITLPVEVRRRLGISSGDKVRFCVEEGRTVLLPDRGEGNVFTAWLKNTEPMALPDGKPSLEYWRELRGHLDEDDN